jgi:hypothetical protein
VEVLVLAGLVVVVLGQMHKPLQQLLEPLILAVAVVVVVKITVLAVMAVKV